jgi:hypothetical protein
MAYYADTLALVRAAIAALLAPGGVSSYSIDGQTFTLHDLDKLERMEARYSRLANEESGTGKTGPFYLASLR